MIRIRWFPPAWVQIRYNETLLYIDPAYLKTYYRKHPGKIEYSTWPDEIDGLPEALPPADGIFLTHGHKDHCKRATITRLCKPGTIICGPTQCKAEVGAPLQIVQSGESITIKDFQIQPVPAYNTAEGSATRKVHKKGTCLGYIVKTNDKAIYHPGDTSFIPEMKELGEIDLAFMPIDGTFTMNIEEAIRAVAVIKPSIAIPIHDMGKNDPYRFQEEVERKKGSEVRVLKIGEAIEL